MEARLENTVRARREGLGLSQQALAERVGVSRQAIVAIEAGRQVPSTALALLLAQVLGTPVEALFRLAGQGELTVRWWGDGAEGAAARAAVGQVEGRWVGHPLGPDATVAADGVLMGKSGAEGRVQAFLEPELLARSVLVAGCAPLLGALAQRVGRRFFDARMTWLSASSQRALALLEGGGVHVAGVHLLDPAAAEDNTRALRQRLPGRRLLVVNLTRWQEGLLVAPGNPKRIRGVQDLLRARLRFARREAGAGATKLVERLLKDAGAPRLALAGVLASGHEDVARRVQCGAADVGVAIEGVALAAGLDFIPLVEERFDLVVPAELAEAAPVRRVLEALDDPGFRRELAHLPGYDGGLAGHVTTVEAA